MSRNNLRSLEEVMTTFLAYAPPSMKGHYQVERVRKLMKHLGDPQEKMNVIHIAGTSGKTSTAYFIRGLLEAAGKRTGLTISPHITAINERVQIDGVPLQPSRFIAYANEFLAIVATTDLAPTYFELLVGMAYWVFAKEGIEYAIIETGLGGSFDGTNTVSRANKVCVITDIGLDHTEILGDTLAKIAAHKAGIIQPGNQIFIRRQNNEILQVIQGKAKAQHATVTIVSDGKTPPSLPVFQQHNWALAQAAWHYLQRRDGVSELNAAQLAEVALQMPPGRWEIYHYKGKTIILDGAHNPQKIQALQESLRAAHMTSTAVLANVVEAPAPKIQQSLDSLQSFTSHLIVPEFSAGQDLKSRRSLLASTFAQLAMATGIKSVEIEPNLSRALELLLARPEKTLVITGSLYLVSAVRDELRRHVGL